MLERSHDTQRSRKPSQKEIGAPTAEVIAMLIGKADLQLRVLPHAHQRQGMLLELLAGGGEFGAGLRALEQRTPKEILEPFDARRHRRLRDVHFARGVDETSGLGNHQKRAREVDVHRARLVCEALKFYLSKIPIVVTGKFRL